MFVHKMVAVVELNLLGAWQEQEDRIRDLAEQCGGTLEIEEIKWGDTEGECNVTAQFPDQASLDAFEAGLPLLRKR